MSDMKFISAGPGLPNWQNPISHAVVANNVCYVSGQLSIGLDGRYIAGTIREEAELAFQNFFAALDAAGYSKEEVVFVDIAFVNLADLDEVNVLFMEYFKEDRRPARTVYEVAALPFGGKIKIMGTAVKT